jgi:hypothetical protein
MDAQPAAAPAAARDASEWPLDEVRETAIQRARAQSALHRADEELRRLLAAAAQQGLHPDDVRKAIHGHPAPAAGALRIAPNSGARDGSVLSAPIT